MSKHHYPLAIALSLILCSPFARADEELAATPYRPTISNPAELSVPGWLEVETGIARAKTSSTSWQNDTPWLFKLAISEDFGIMLGGDAPVRQTDSAGATLSGFGDTSLTLKHHWAVDENSAFGLEWGAKFATADDGLGSGKTDYGFNGIYSRDIGKTRIDANLGATRLGLNEAGLAHWQYPWAVAVSHPIGEDWGVAFEESGVYRRGAAAATQLLIAASYSVTKRLVDDAGMTTGSTDAAPKWSAFMGVTYLAAKFW